MYRRIRDLREDNDLTQEKLAKKLNMSQRGYSHIETGNNDISTEILIKLSKIYGVTTDYILGISDISVPYKKTKNDK